MDCLTPIEVMIRTFEEVQMFFLANDEEDRKLRNTQLITHALIKMLATGLYAKPIERWSNRDVKDHQLWSDF